MNNGDRLYLLQRGKEGDEVEKDMMIGEKELKMRRNHDFLWVSPDKKKNYLKSTDGCLMLFFKDVEEMVKYIAFLSRKGFTAG